MNWDSIESNFDEFGGGVQEQLGMLTDHQLESVVGRHEPHPGSFHENFRIEGDDAEGPADDYVDDFDIEMEDIPRLQ
jgi:uncharacterized protein YjbJ (UPF0337 family)